MTRQLFVGLVTEGNTDERFLESIVKKTFEQIAFECQGEIEIELSIIKITKTTFAENVFAAAKIGVERYGIMVLCVHADADEETDSAAFANRIDPATEMVRASPDNDLCRIITAIVPIRMTEAWMLADRDLLKREIGTDLNDSDLGIHRDAERIADPKQVIAEAIRLARVGLTKRRRSELKISDLYLPVGQKMNLARLAELSSYSKFKDSVRAAFRELNYLH
jgi:hypothetical protein